MAIRLYRTARAGGLAVAAYAALVAVGCSGSPSQPAAANPAQRAAGSPSVSPSPKVFTGTQLRAMLITDVPAGFTLDTKATGNSGTALQSPSTGAVAPKSKCSELSATSFISANGVNGVSFAQSDYEDKKRNEISQEIDAYRAGDAADVMTRMRKVFAQCATFHTKADGVTATEHVKTSKVSGLGDDAIKAVITAPQFYGGTTLMVVRVGDNVISAFYNDTSGSYSDGHITDLVRKLVANVRAGS